MTTLSGKKRTIRYATLNDYMMDEEAGAMIGNAKDDSDDEP
jgi:hypothetical protein